MDHGNGSPSRPFGARGRPPNVRRQRVAGPDRAHRELRRGDPGMVRAELPALARFDRGAKRPRCRATRALGWDGSASRHRGDGGRPLARSRGRDQRDPRDPPRRSGRGDPHLHRRPRRPPSVDERRVHRAERAPLARDRRRPPLAAGALAGPRAGLSPDDGPRQPEQRTHPAGASALRTNATTSFSRRRSEARPLSSPTTARSTLASVSEPTTAVYSVKSKSAGSWRRISPSFIPFSRNPIARSRSGSSTAANRSNASGPSLPASRTNIGNSGHSPARRKTAWMTASARSQYASLPSSASARASAR